MSVSPRMYLLHHEPHRGATTIAGLLLVALTLVRPATAIAQHLTEDVPVVGGTAATAKALGMDVVPDRPLFLAELIRVIYDAREGRNADIDAKLARLATHRHVTERFQSTLAALQADTIVISLAMSPVKNERGRLREFLDLVGLKLRERNGMLAVGVSDDKRAADRVKLLSSLGIDVATIAAQLNGGETVRIELARDTIPVPLTAKLWSDAVFGRPVTAEQLFTEIMGDRRAALIALGLASLDDDTLRYFATHPNVLTVIHERAAAGFAAFGDALRIRGNRVVPPGGTDGVLVWEAVLGAPVAQPELFVPALFSTGRGHAALLYQTIAHLDVPHVRFAVGSWLPDPSARVAQFKDLLDGEMARVEWDVDLRPFLRPSHDPSLLLARIRVLPNGAPAPPASRVFWQRAFESTALDDDAARLLRNTTEDGPITAGWLAQRVTDGKPSARAERADQLAFGQRVFAAAPAADLPDALLAVRSLPRFRMLPLALDRMAVRSAKSYVAAAKQAERISLLKGQRGFTAIAQFQAAVAIVGRLVRVRSLTPAAGAALVDAAAAVPLTDGAFVGGMARWVERALLPALVTQPVDDVDAQLVASLSGAAPKDAAVRRVAWEGRTYTVDHAGPEQRRLARVRDRMGAPSIRLALDLEHLATRVATASEVQPVRAALGELRQFASALTVKEKQAAVLPPGVEASKSPGDVANRVADELAKISRAQDLPKASSAIAPVFILCDEVLADALFSLAYALDLGSPDGTTLLGGNVSRRHDFGFAIRVDELRERAAWATPVRVISAGVPWHIGGSALSLDTALSSLALRRIDTGDLPQAPVLTSPDRDTFTKTLVLMNPFDLSDETRDAIVAAIERGRERVAAIARDPSLWDPTADEIRMDGWRRRAGKWALANDAAMVTSFFSLSELLHLGAPPPDLAVHAWGMARDASDACVCIEAPTPGRAAIVVGRPQFGLLAAEVADVNLHVAEVLRARGLPASLAPGVLAGALQDYIEKVRPMHPSDWLTLVREAQAIPEDRLDDYVAALTTGGPLAPERASASPEGGQR